MINILSPCTVLKFQLDKLMKEKNLSFGLGIGSSLEGIQADTSGTEMGRDKMQAR